MKEQSPVKSKPYLKERHIEVTQNYLMELDFDSSKGLSIRIVSDELIQLEQVLSLQISDDIMNSSLRGCFLDVERVFAFMKNKNNIQIDIKEKTILLKAYKMLGSTILDESMKLQLSKNELKTDKIIIQMHKIQNKKLQVKLSQIKELYQNHKKSTNDQFSKLAEQLKNIGVKSAERQRKSNNQMKIIVFIMIVIMIAIGIFSYSSKADVVVVSQIIGDQYEDKMDKLNAKVGEIHKIIADYEKYKEKLNQLSFSLTSKMGNKDMDVIKKQITDKNDRLMSIIDERVLEIGSKVQLSIKQIKELTKSLVDEQISQLKNQIKDKMGQKSSVQINESPLEQTDKKQMEKSTKKIHSIQTKLEDLQKIIKRTSIFDLTSSFADSFSIEGKTITSLAPSGRWTQLLLRDIIPYQKPIIYKFKIIRSPSNAIILGVVDNFRIKHRSSLPHNNTIAYSGRGQLWKNGVMETEKTGGFQQGDLIQMHVQLWKGKIEWSVNGKLIQSASSQKLLDNTIAFRPYLEMAHMKDIIEVLQVI